MEPWRVTQVCSQLCAAIRSLRCVKLVHRGTALVVEPHQVAYNRGGEFVLTGWVRPEAVGSTESSDPWTTYLLSEIEVVVMLDDHFDGPRPGYEKAPNDRLLSPVCQL